MSFPRYPAYKDSGVEWLGEVPEHWRVITMQRCVYVAEGQINPGEPAYSDMILIAPNHIESGTGKLLALETASEQGADSGKYLCQSGDVVYSKIRPTLRKVCIATQPCLCSADMYPLQAHSGLTNQFLFWTILSENFSSLAVLESQRVAMPKINRESLKVIPVAVPSPPEQTTIATFLDRETAKIDALVSDYRTLIELLQEKRQAVISHAVTKGLDRTVPMKDSGVEWLGEVPEHWSVAPLKYLVSMQSGGTPSKDNLDFWNGDIPWASAKDMKAEVLWDTTDHVTQNAIEAGAASLVPAGSILVVVRGMILARTFPVAAIAGPMAINQDLKALQTTDRVDASYLACCLRASEQESRRRIDEAGHGTKALRMDAWTSMELPVPPVTEQTTIAAFLARETAAIDSLITDAEEAITLLQERRTALISAAVTGKIDVRGLVDIPETDLARSCG